MDHDGTARAMVDLIEGVGVADIEGQVVIAVGVHLFRTHLIKSLRCLAVSFRQFGTKGSAAPGVDGKRLDQFPFRLPFRGHPDFKFPAFLEQSQVNGTAQSGSTFNDKGPKGGRDAFLHGDKEVAGRQGGRGVKHEKRGGSRETQEQDHQFAREAGHFPDDNRMEARRQASLAPEI